MRQILTPCHPSKRCPICEARAREVLGNRIAQDPVPLWVHQAGDAGRRCAALVATGAKTEPVIEQIYALARRAGTYANLALGPYVVLG